RHHAAAVDRRRSLSRPHSARANPAAPLRRHSERGAGRVRRSQSIRSHDKFPPMTAPLKSIEGEGDVARTMREIGRRAREAARTLALAPSAAKDAALAAMARTIVARSDEILAANAEDVAEAKAQGATAAFVDRLAL